MILYKPVSNNGWHIEEVDTEKSKLLYGDTVLYHGTLYSGEWFRTWNGADSYINNGLNWIWDRINKYELEKIYRG